MWRFGVPGSPDAVQAGLVIASKAVLSAGPRLFKYVFLADGCAGPDAAVLQNPLVLTRLALLLQVRSHAPMTRLKPFQSSPSRIPDDANDGQRTSR